MSEPVHEYPHPVAELLTQAIADLGYLGSHGALAGVAAVIAERRRQVDQKVEHENTVYAAEGALDFGEYARAGALCAAVIDSDPAAEAAPDPSGGISIQDEIRYRYGKFR